MDTHSKFTIRGFANRAVSLLSSCVGSGFFDSIDINACTINNKPRPFSYPFSFINLQASTIVSSTIDLKESKSVSIENI